MDVDWESSLYGRLVVTAQKIQTTSLKDTEQPVCDVPVCDVVRDLSDDDVSRSLGYQFSE